MKAGANEHWNNFITGTWGDFHGRFCRWDPNSCDLLVRWHSSRNFSFSSPLTCTHPNSQHVACNASLHFSLICTPVQIETHLLRSYHLHGQGSKDVFLRQDNKIFFEASSSRHSSSSKFDLCSCTNIQLPRTDVHVTCGMQDERGTVSRGPWDIHQDKHSTELGIQQ